MANGGGDGREVPTVEAPVAHVHEMLLAGFVLKGKKARTAATIMQ